MFQRKWQTLPQYQQTRGTLAMLAQWVSWAFVEQHQKGINEPLLTLGRAPLHDPSFQSVVLGQLGEPRLGAAIRSDIAGEAAHARALDADTKGALRDIHRRAGTAVLFESSGGQVDKVAHLPELRFALGEPGLDTTSIDNAAVALEKKGYFIRKAGTDGFRFGFQPTLKKVVADRRASLDEDEDILKPMRTIVRKEFEHKAALPLLLLPPDKDGDEVPDVPRLTVVILDPQTEWDERGAVRETLAAWTKKRGTSDRSYPAALIWCLRKAGRDIRDRVEQWQAWRKVKQEIDEGTLQGEFEPADRAKVGTQLSEAGKAKKLLARPVSRTHRRFDCAAADQRAFFAFSLSVFPLSSDAVCNAGVTRHRGRLGSDGPQIALGSCSQHTTGVSLSRGPSRGRDACDGLHLQGGGRTLRPHLLPVGSEGEVRSDSELIAATSRNLAAEARNGRFREDLRARSSLWTFPLPGLRERTEDTAGANLSCEPHLPGLSFSPSRILHGPGE